MSAAQPNDSTIDFTPRLIRASDDGEAPPCNEPLTLVEVSTGRQWQVTTEAVIGRHSRCSIHLSAPDVSRRHARLRPIGGVWWISDCHSLNGVYINGCKVAESPLHHGDEIQVGDQVLQVILGDCTSDVARSVWRSIAAALGQRGDPSVQRRAS